MSNSLWPQLLRNASSHLKLLSSEGFLPLIYWSNLEHGGTGTKSFFCYLLLTQASLWHCHNVAPQTLELLGWHYHIFCSKVTWEQIIIYPERCMQRDIHNPKAPSQLFTNIYTHTHIHTHTPSQLPSWMDLTVVNLVFHAGFSLCGSPGLDCGGSSSP